MCQLKYQLLITPISIEELWYKLYADDLVIVAPRKQVPKIVFYLKKISREFNLKINEKKSGILYYSVKKDEILYPIFSIPIN